MEIWKALLFLPLVYCSAVKNDVNECAEMICIDPRAKCVNTIGSFYCACPLGFQLPHNSPNGLCQDINECAELVCRDSRAKCINTIGSFYCVCPMGFYMPHGGNELCQDIDECKMLSPCFRFEECRNTLGSFLCIEKTFTEPVPITVRPPHGL